MNLRQDQQQLKHTADAGWAADSCCCMQREQPRACCSAALTQAGGREPVMSLPLTSIAEVRWNPEAQDVGSEPLNLHMAGRRASGQAGG